MLCTKESLVDYFTELEKVWPDVQVLEILKTGLSFVTCLRSCIVVKLQKFLQRKHAIIVLIVLLDELLNFWI